MGGGESLFGLVGARGGEARVKVEGMERAWRGREGGRSAVPLVRCSCSRS